MTGDRQREARRVFMEVAELPGGEQIAALAKACAGDEALRAEVDALLQAEAQADGFMADPTSDAAGTQNEDATIAATPREKPGEPIGRYKLLEQIGEGGFGTVWAAEQREPIKRRVALKIIKLGMDTKQVIARFEAERQALAMMDHPNIAKVLDAGSTETGRPFFVMELVKGVPILEYCDKEKLDTRARLDLFTRVCHAIQHAHQKGIIHRDIKPSNVLITLHDGVPVPKVIDFGIAKATNQELTEKTIYTQHRQMVGTPAYMSPEQAEMSGLDIDTRSDIYSLGVLLYELLTGTTPFDSQSLLEAGFAEMMRIIREETPHKPSTRLSSLGETGTRTAEQRRENITKLSSLIRGDLDWIVMKCLEKDRTRRYETANGLAADIVRHLTDEPVLAGPPSTKYKLAKFVKRYRGQVIAGGVVAATLLLAVVGTSTGMAWALSEQDRADTEATNALLAAEAERAAKLDAMGQKQQAEEAAAEARWQAYRASVLGAQGSIDAGEIRTARLLLEDAPLELRDWEWHSLHADLDESLAVLRGHGARVESVSLSPDGTVIASGALDDSVRLWDSESGEQLLSLVGQDGSAMSVTFSPDGTLIAAVATERGLVRLWDARSGEVVAVLRGYAPALAVAFSPNGSQLASGGSSVQLWDVSTGKRTLTLDGHDGPVQSVAFSPDGSYVASGSRDGTVRLWDASSGQERAVLDSHESSVWSIAFSTDGSRLASGSSDGTVRLWDTANEKEVAVLRGHERTVWSVEFSPDGLRLASGASDKTVRLWDAVRGEQLAILRGHEDVVSSVAFSPDGAQVVSSSHDKTIRVWDSALGETSVFQHQPAEQIYAVALSPDGLRLVSGANDNTVRLWDAAGRQALAVLRGHEQRVDAVAFSPDGAHIVSGAGDGTVRLWDASSGEALDVLNGHESWVNAVAYSPDGSRVVSGAGNMYGWTPDDTTVRLWDVASGEQIAVLHGHVRPITSVGFSSDGSLIASGSMDETVRIWDAVQFEQLLILQDGENQIHSVAFSPDGSRVVAGSSDGTIRMWNTSDGRALASIPGHEGAIVTSVVFSPDGSRVVSGSHDNTVRLWHVSTGQELLTLRGHEGAVTSVACSADGSRIASASWDGTMRLWEAVEYRDRVVERDAVRRAEEIVGPFIDDLFSQGLDWSAVVDRVGTDASLSDSTRRAALNLALKKWSTTRE